MLDESMIVKLLTKDPLKCNKCKKIFIEDESYEADIECLEETGICCFCYDEDKEFERDIYKNLEDNG